MLIGYRITNKSYTNVKVPLLYINNSSVINNNRDPNQETYYKPNYIDIALEVHLYNTYAHAVNYITLKAKHAHQHKVVKSLKKKIYCLNYYRPNLSYLKIIKLIGYKLKLVSIIVAFIVDKNL